MSDTLTFSDIFVWLIAVLLLVAAYITGMVVTVISGNWLLLIAQVLLPPLATVHGIGHVFGIWM